MFLEPLAMLRDALEHPEYGVNVKLPTVPKDPDVASPRAIVKILDPSRDLGAAAGNFGTETPALVIDATTPVTVEGEVTTSKRDTELSGLALAIGVVMDNRAMDTPEGIREAWLILRGVGMCLREWLSNARGADRVRNSIQIRDALRWDYYPVPFKFEKLSVSVGCALVLTVNVRDIAP